jgi:hypothetical protein
MTRGRCGGIASSTARPQSRLCSGCCPSRSKAVLTVPATLQSFRGSVSWALRRPLCGCCRHSRRATLLVPSNDRCSPYVNKSSPLSADVQRRDDRSDADWKSRPVAAVGGRQLAGISSTTRVGNTDAVNRSRPCGDDSRSGHDKAFVTTNVTLPIHRRWFEVQIAAPVIRILPWRSPALAAATASRTRSTG